MKKISKLLDLVNSLSIEDEVVGLDDLSLSNMIGKGGYANKNGSCTGTNNSCGNSSCSGSTNGTCNNTSCSDEEEEL